jgi:hypothetical protein
VSVSLVSVHFVDLFYHANYSFILEPIIENFVGDVTSSKIMAVRRHDTKHNEMQHNDTQHNDIQHNDTQHNDIQQNNK